MKRRPTISTCTDTLFPYTTLFRFVFVSGSTWDWYRPIYAGDQLFSFGGTESVVEKESEFAERSVFVTYVSVKMNQRAEIVAISRTLAIHTERKTAREKGKYSSIEPATYTDDDIAKLDDTYAKDRKSTRLNSSN